MEENLINCLPQKNTNFNWKSESHNTTYTLLNLNMSLQVNGRNVVILLLRKPNIGRIYLLKNDQNIEREKTHIYRVADLTFVLRLKYTDKSIASDVWWWTNETNRRWQLHRLERGHSLYCHIKHLDMAAAQRMKPVSHMSAGVDIFQRDMKHCMEARYNIQCTHQRTHHHHHIHTERHNHTHTANFYMQ